MDIADFKIDLDAAEDGQYFPLDENSGLVIAQWNNKEHAKYLRTVYKKHGARLRNNQMDDEEARLLMAGQWPHVLKGWKGMKLDGEEVEYTPKLVVDLASNPQFRDFFKRIQSIAEAEENFRVKSLKDLGEELPTM